MRIILLLLSCFSLLACKKNEKDEHAPSIKLLGVGQTLIEDQICGNTYYNIVKINTGEELNVKMHLTDNEIVSHYKVFLYDWSNCNELTKDNYLGVNYETRDIVNVNAKDIVIDRSWIVDNIYFNRTFLLEFVAVDQAGNESLEPIHLFLKVENRWDISVPSEPGGKGDWNTTPPIDTIKPMLLLSNFSDTLSYANMNDSLNIQGYLIDNLNLINTKIKYYITKNGVLEGMQTENTLMVNDTLKVLNFHYTPNPSWIEQDMKFYFRAIDAAQNILEIEKSFFIVP